MLTFSYTLSTTTISELKKIEETRNKILLELVPPKLEVRLKFANTITLIEKSLFLSGRAPSKKDILQVISGDTELPQSTEILQIKNSYDYINESWLLAQDQVSNEALANIIKIMGLEHRVSDRQIDDAVRFITVNPEHPLVQAALAFIIMSSLLPQNNDSIKTSIIVSNLFAYDYGYDFRGQLNLQEYFISDLINLQSKTKAALSSKQLTEFIEYFVLAFSLTGEKALEKLRQEASVKRKHTTLYNLTAREGGILSLFQIPDVRITNKNIQKEFGISQITASRDLSKLATLGLIFRKGKGRSVYYTK